MLGREFSKKAEMSAASSLWVTGWSTVVLAVSDDTTPALIWLMNGEDIASKISVIFGIQHV